MKSPKHTKGPWKIVEFDESFEIQSQNNKIIADVWIKSNAHLIAAAPEMYEALEKLTTMCCDEASKIAGIQELAKQILKKARGES